MDERLYPCYKVKHAGMQINGHSDALTHAFKQAKR